MRKLQKLSLIVPCYNEQEVIETSHQKLACVLDSLAKRKKCVNTQIIYINDGSTDRTREILAQLFSQNKNVRVIELRRNFGLQGALSAGLLLADADAIVTIDADLQDPPEAIEEMITHYENGYDLVLGVREDRTTDTFLKRITAEGYYWLMHLLGVEIVHNHGDFRLMAKPLVDEFNQLSERNRFIRGMILTLDNHYATVIYKRQPRMQGVTKFSFQKMLSFSLDGILSFSFVPLRLVFIMGLFFCFMAALGSIWVLYTKFINIALPGWSSVVLPLFIFSGLQMLSLGIIGEYLGRLYIEVKRRPLFSVRRDFTH